MGLKMSFAVLLTTEPGMAITAESVHDSDAADRIARLLMPKSGHVGTATLGEAMYSDRLMIGVYGSSVMSGDPRLFEARVRGREVRRRSDRRPHASRPVRGRRDAGRLRPGVAACGAGRPPLLSDEEWEAVSMFPFSTESFGNVVIGDLLSALRSRGCRGTCTSCR